MRQGCLQEVLGRSRGQGVRAIAAPSPVAQPLGYNDDNCVKARHKKLLPYLLLISNYLDLGRAKHDVLLVEYSTLRLMVGYRPVTAHNSFLLNRYEIIFFF